MWVHFLITAKSWRRVHSPMVFGLLERIRKNNQDYSNYSEIETLRKRLIHDDRKITFVDYGDNQEIKRRTIASIAKSAAKNKHVCRMLSEVVNYVQPITGIELGTSLGISMLYQMKSCPTMHFTSIEGSPEIADVARRNAKELHLEPHVHVGNFKNQLPQVLEQLNQLDYCFIDGHHQKAPTLSYFNQIAEKMGTQGCIVVDDIYWSFGMQRAWNKLIQHPKAALTLDLYHFGVVFIREGVEKQHFKIRG